MGDGEWLQLAEVIDIRPEREVEDGLYMELVQRVWILLGSQDNSSNILKLGSHRSSWFFKNHLPDEDGQAQFRRKSLVFTWCVYGGVHNNSLRRTW